MADAQPSTAGPSNAPVKTRKRPGQREQTVAKHEEILRAAMEVFGTLGFRGGTLDDVATRVGMTHAGVLHHFGSKVNLLHEVLTYRDQLDDAATRAVHGKAFFRHLIATARLNMTRPGIVQTYVVLSAEAVTQDNPGYPFFRDRFTGLRELVLGELRDIQNPDAPLPEADLVNAASCIIACMDGLQVQWLIDSERVDLGQATAFAIDAIVDRVVSGDVTQP
ncbi:MAG: TetR/AcrR family transcriptional regulator [Propionibacteriaceae bacterium]|nr:TetR/AcrR family transcriptional regulator [Propionibacteriaceae bacterium]